MSASLVGSEMCIRDRFGIHSRAGDHGFCTDCAPPPDWVLERLGGTWPVSYTHLTLPTICSV
eukprot:15162261-Alexandrium_andersonii.AAC.1